MNDKRTPHTDALDSLGSLITENEKRDAIHLAVEPAVAGEYLFPGDDVGFLDDGTIGVCYKPVGIVDPFLKDQVEPGQRFWLVVYPRQITSLRHVWTHPAFDEPRASDDHAIKAAYRKISSAPADWTEPQLVAEPTTTDRVATGDFESRAWLEDYADELGVGYDDLIRHAGLYLHHGLHWNMGPKFEGVRLRDEFWNHYENVTNVSVDEDERWNFFTCSC